MTGGLASANLGLSPRVRGNRLHHRQPGLHRRSIPACAGEPRRGQSVARQGRVYPRVCGGTGGNAHNAQTGAGLSPRVRGNPAGAFRWGSRGGSIPACAGEPGPAAGRPGASRVYPRVCGGTRCGLKCWWKCYGLSPRVRGNLPLPEKRHRRGGSIPACAGEPVRVHTERRQPEVYPRVCGGTKEYAAVSVSGQGLSPRVRGNPSTASGPSCQSRSIPACAGEPARLPSAQ